MCGKFILINWVCKLSNIKFTLTCTSLLNVPNQELCSQHYIYLIITHLNSFLMFIEHMTGIAGNSSHVNTSSNSPITVTSTETSGTV